MARKNAGNREVSPTDAGDMLGMTKQAVGHWANKAPDDVLVVRDGKRLLKWPEFPKWYHKQLGASTKLQEERRLKLVVERERSELELKLRRGEIVLKGHEQDELSRIYWRLRAQLWGQITNYMRKFIGLTEAESIRVTEQFGWDLEWAMKNTPLYPRLRLLEEAATNPANREAVTKELAELAAAEQPTPLELPGGSPDLEHDHQDDDEDDNR